MKNRLIRFPFTSVAVVFAVVVVSAAWIGQVNLIEIPVSVLNRIEKSAIADVVTAFMLVILALVVDTIRAAHREMDEQQAERRVERQAEQVRVIRVTMRTVQDIVNKCLNQLQLLRMDAEEARVSEESLKLFDKAIQETSVELAVLGDLKIFAEKEIATGSGA